MRAKALSHIRQYRKDTPVGGSCGIAACRDVRLYFGSLSGPHAGPGCVQFLLRFAVTFPRLLSGDYLFSSPTGMPTPWFAVLTAGFVLLFLMSAFFYWKRAMLAAGNPIMRRLIRRASKSGMWTGGVGIALAILRYVEFPYLSAPVLMYLLVLTIIGIAGYFVYDISERYPVAIYQLQESQLQRRFRPAARPAREPQRPRPAKVRGKQRRR